MKMRANERLFSLCLVCILMVGVFTNHFPLVGVFTNHSSGWCFHQPFSSGWCFHQPFSSGWCFHQPFPLVGVFTNHIFSAWCFHQPFIYVLFLILRSAFCAGWEWKAHRGEGRDARSSGADGRKIPLQRCSPCLSTEDLE